MATPLRSRLWSPFLSGCDFGSPVKVSAFDYSVYGGLKAKVVDVSPDAVQTEKGESYFRVKLIGDASKFSRKAAITPGMTTDVDIKGSRRTILQYLLAPLEKVSQGALRE